MEPISYFKCPACGAENIRSKVVVLGVMKTMLGGYNAYYDEDGNYHYEDPNTYTTSYVCTNDHRFLVARRLGLVDKIIGP